MREEFGEKVTLTGSIAPNKADAPKLIMTIDFSAILANTSNIFRLVSKLSRNAKNRAYIIRSTVNVAASINGIVPYDNLIGDGYLDSIVNSPSKTINSGNSTLVFSSKDQPYLGMNFDSLRFVVNPGATAPTSGQILVYVVEEL